MLRVALELADYVATGDLRIIQTKDTLPNGDPVIQLGFEDYKTEEIFTEYINLKKSLRSLPKDKQKEIIQQWVDAKRGV